MATTAQLNVRMDASLKSAGDSVLASFGFTPADFVRAIWTRLAQGTLDARRLAQETLATERHEPNSDSTPFAAMEHISQDVLEILHGMGVSLASATPQTDPYAQAADDEDQLWSVLDERAKELTL